MAPAFALPVLLLAAACSQVFTIRLAGNGEAVTNTPQEPPPTDRVASAALNPAGCVEKKTPLSLEELGGQFPTNEFADMLATRIAPIWYDDHRAPDMMEKLKRPWCPLPLQTPTFVDEDEELFSYLTSALAVIGKAKPLITSVVQLVSVQGDHRMVQVSNFVCGLKRLGLGPNTALFALSNATATFLRQQFPDVHVLWHPQLIPSIDRFAKRTNVGWINRVAKLVVAAMLVEHDREVLVADLDQFWSQDPIPFLRNLKTPDGKAIEFAAMKDLCWLELNSGFLYYKSTERTKAMLKSALSTVKFSETIDGKRAELIGDNDQYLLNCAFSRAAVSGLEYIVLPSVKFRFGNPGKCHSQSDPHVQQEAPLIWHTSGFSGSYEKEMDTFSAAGLLDLDPEKGTCKPGLRGTPGETLAWSSTWDRMCIRASQGGINAAMCYGDCGPERAMMHANELLRKYRAGWPMPPVDVPHFREHLKVADVGSSDSDRPAPEVQ